MLLLVIIFIAFIGLGTPDSLLGVAWPKIYGDIGVSVSSVSVLMLIVSGCTVISSILSGRVINRFGEGRVAAFSTAMTALGILVISFAQGFAVMCIVSVFLGFGAGAIDAALNNYVALNYKASHMNFLHCFYGIGVTLSPFVLSLTLADGQWRLGYRVVFFVQLAISILLFISLPLWKKNSEKSGNGEDFTPRNMPFFEMIKNPRIIMMWIILMATNVIEYTAGAWGSTYLVEGCGYAADVAANIVTFYYAGMTLGRFGGGILSSKLSGWKIVFVGLSVLLCATGLLLFPIPKIMFFVAFFLIGLGNGPIYPNLLHLTPKNFGEDVSQSVMGSQMAAAYTGVMLTPIFLGLITEYTGIDVYPVIMAVTFAVLVVFTILFKVMSKKSGVRD